MRLRSFSLPVEHFSASSLGTAIICPEKWRRRYLLHERERTHVGAFVGIVDHATHAENFQQKIESGEDLELPWMQGKYRARWATQREKEEPVWDGEAPDDMLARGLLMVEAYHTLVSPSVHPLKVEERFEETLPGVPRPLIGYMDVVQSDVITERKTSKRRESKPKADWRFQARVYQMVADLPTEWHVVTTQATPQLVTPETEPALYQEKGNPDTVLLLIQQTVRRLNDLYERYGAEGTWPLEGIFHTWACNYCGYKETGCPAWVVGQ